MASVLSSGVFYDGFDDSPRLAHPEGVAVHEDGSVWCGSETGHVFRISPDGQDCQTVAEFGGFLLGIAFDNNGMLYVCHQSEGTVYRLDSRTGDKQRLYKRGDGPLLPNHLVVDERRRRVLVSDSRRLDNPGPSIWQISLDSGNVSPWLSAPLDFANGLAFTPDAQALLVAVSWEKSVRRVEIQPDGGAGEMTVQVAGLSGIPDGLAFLDTREFLVSLYEPSALMQSGGNQGVRLPAHDETAHVMCHPTNIAFRGNELFTANLGRWHITRLLIDQTGPTSSFPRDLTWLANG